MCGRVQRPVTTAAVDINTGAVHVLQLVRAKSRWVVSIVLLSTGVAIAAAYFITPVYRASVTLFPADSSASPMAGLNSVVGGLGGLASLAGVNIGSNKDSVQAIAILKSRQFTERFINENGLVQRLYSDEWDAKTLNWRVNIHKIPTLFDAYKRFDKKIRRVTEDQKTGLVILDIDWVDSTEGARWANELVSRINEDMRKRAIAEAAASIDLLTRQLDLTSVVPVHQAITSAIEYYVKRSTLAAVRPEYAFTVIDPGKAVDRDGFIRPNRELYIGVGFAFGLLLSIGFVLATDSLERK